jgi:hypothetical protein
MFTGEVFNFTLAETNCYYKKYNQSQEYKIQQPVITANKIYNFIALISDRPE